MRIRAQTVAIHFLSVIGQLLRAQTAFEKGPRVNAWRRVGLEVDQITTVVTLD